MFSTQLPLAAKETTPDAIEQIADEPELTVITELKPLVAVPVGVYVLPLTLALGAVEVNETVWVPLTVALAVC